VKSRFRFPTSTSEPDFKQNTCDTTWWDGTAGSGTVVGEMWPLQEASHQVSFSKDGNERLAEVRFTALSFENQIVRLTLSFSRSEARESETSKLVLEYPPAGARWP